MEKENVKLSAGTQVVSLVEVRGTNNSLVHPRGARVPVRVETKRERLLAVKRGDCNARSAQRNWGNTSQDLGSPMPWAGVATWRKEMHRNFERALAETKQALNAPTSKRRIVSSSERGGRWRMRVEADLTCPSGD